MKYTHMIKRLSIIVGIEHRLPTFGLNVTCKQTRTKVVHKKVCKSFNKIRNSKSKKITQPFNKTQVILCDVKSCT